MIGLSTTPNYQLVVKERGMQKCINLVLRCSKAGELLFKYIDIELESKNSGLKGPITFRDGTLRPKKSLKVKIPIGSHPNSISWLQDQRRWSGKSTAPLIIQICMMWWKRVVEIALLHCWKHVYFTLWVLLVLISSSYNATLATSLTPSDKPRRA